MKTRKGKARKGRKRKDGKEGGKMEGRKEGWYVVRSCYKWWFATRENRLKRIVGSTDFPGHLAF